MPSDENFPRWRGPCTLASCFSPRRPSGTCPSARYLLLYPLTLLQSCWLTSLSSRPCRYSESPAQTPFTDLHCDSEFISKAGTQPIRACYHRDYCTVIPADGPTGYKRAYVRSATIQRRGVDDEAFSYFRCSEAELGAVFSSAVLSQSHSQIVLLILPRLAYLTQRRTYSANRTRLRLSIHRPSVGSAYLLFGQ